MCSLPKFAGTLILGLIAQPLKLKIKLILYTQNRYTLVYRFRVLHVLCVRGFYEVSIFIMFNHLIINRSSMSIILRHENITLNRV